jgi:alpha/beta superfamily hydrolase
MTAHTIRADFEGHSGARLAARLDLPAGTIRAWALFAHCFTCSKDTLAARRISGALASAGIAVMRFDFTGLGSSDGEFASTNFSSNVEDLRSAAEWLEKHYMRRKFLSAIRLAAPRCWPLPENLPR